MMPMHLDLTLRDASDRLADDFEADIADYDAVEAEIAEMSHILARGIVLQFPQKFSLTRRHVAPPLGPRGGAAGAMTSRTLE